LPEERRIDSDRETLASLTAFLSRARWRLLAVAALHALTAGAASAAAAILAGRLGAWSGRTVAVTTVTGAGIIVGSIVLRAWRRWTTTRVAALVEIRAPGFQNLLVTSAEIASRHRRVHPALTTEVLRQTGQRLAAVYLPAAIPVRHALANAALACTGAVLVWWSVPGQATSGALSAPLDSGRVRPLAIVSYAVTVEPPAYADRAATVFQSPTEVRAIEGSRVRVDAVTTGGGIVLLDADRGPLQISSMGDRHTGALVADGSRALVLRPAAAPAARAHLIWLIVEPDRRPIVRIVAPGRDLVFATAGGRVPLQVHAEDDVGLESLEVRLTRVAGSGESFTFAESTVPLAVSRPDRSRWSGRGEVGLESLRLEAGDLVVYRAMARDGRPGADPAVSESYIIEIGAQGGAASAGFAVPQDRDRQAISQQMVIVKTERLQAARGTLAPDAFAEQARMLAVEQRMVRAEFVFMTGGEVADEIAEAEHAHEIVEGRFENEGQVELLTAIREMSRAEAALNDADTRRALVFERAALAALQRAFNRRRYVLRTLPERARIDLTRRLTGERAGVRPWIRSTSDPREPDELAMLRALMGALASRLRSGAPGPSYDGQILSTLGTSGTVGTLFDDPPIRVALRALAEGDAADPAAAEKAAVDLMQLVAARARRRLGPTASSVLPREALAGHFADELRRRGPVQ
jgi:hypothetical protein